MRTRLRSKLGVLGVLVAGAVLAGVAPPAQAGDGYGRSIRRGGHRYQDAYYAGTLRIGDQRFVLRNDTSVRNEIAYLFQRLGYEAWSEHGRVYIQLGYHHRPRIRWLAGSHRVGTWYEGDCLVMKIIPPAYGRHGVHGKEPYRPGWRGIDCRRRGPWRSGGRRGRPYTRGSIGLGW